MNKLHPGARWIFRFNTYSRFGIIFFVLVYILIISIVDKRKASAYSFLFGDSFMSMLIFVLLGSIILILIIGEIYSRLAYNRWFYEVTNEEIKIEKGIIWKKYTSIPYERIQNIDIHRGIIARIFGFSTLEIETAGQSGYSGSYGFRFGRRSNHTYRSEGHLPAIDINGAEKIREFIMKKVKHAHKDGSGL